jgi:hypothetical protein
MIHHPGDQPLDRIEYGICVNDYCSGSGRREIWMEKYHLTKGE